MNKIRRSLNSNSAGTMADIAFLLLIFFLVTTTIESDKGIKRSLPPISEGPPINLNKRNVLVVNANGNDQLLVGSELTEIADLREICKGFITNNGKRRDWSLSPQVATISIQNDVKASYDFYVGLQNEIAAAYRELRNEYARAKYGKEFNALQAEPKQAVLNLYPTRISEAEPKS